MSKFAPKTRRLIQALIALLLCIGLAAAAFRVQRQLERADFANARLAQREAVLFELNKVRYRLEAETASALYLVSGLATYISINPDLSQEQFRMMASALRELQPDVISLVAAPDMVIRFVHPMEENEQVLGLDYRVNEEQRDAVIRVRETGRPVIAGPVELVQGGRAFVARFPVLLDRGTERERFWGIVSAPIALEDLFRKAGLFDPQLSIEIAARGEDGLGASGEVFFGEPTLFHGDSVRSPVRLFTGSWELAGEPKGGWVEVAPNRNLFRAVTWTVSSLLIVIVLLLLVYVIKIDRDREREATVSRAKSRFLANMSHEVRTPLNGIYGVAQLLRSSELDCDQSEWADIIVQSARSLNDLLSDILNLSKLESGVYQVKAEPVELEPLVESIVSVVRIEANQKGIAFFYSGVPRKRSLVIVDPVILRQVLWNLLSNAVKFTEKGSVRLDLEACEAPGSEGAGLRIVVTDTGVGIAANRLESIFGDYVQEDSGTARRFGGTGLGLAIVRRLIDQLEGEIKVQSEKGKGSRFEAVIPVRLEL